MIEGYKLKLKSLQNEDKSNLNFIAQAATAEVEKQCAQKIEDLYDMIEEEKKKASLIQVQSQYGQHENHITTCLNEYFRNKIAKLIARKFKAEITAAKEPESIKNQATRITRTSLTHQ